MWVNILGHVQNILIFTNAFNNTVSIIFQYEFYFQIFDYI